MIRCLLFDCDGTLVDSERLCNIGLVIKFRDLGVQLDADELLLRFRGWKLAKVLDVIRQESSVVLPDNFVVDYREKVAELFEQELKPVVGIENVLDQLGHPKAVVSSGPRHKIEHALKICGLTKYFGGNIYSSYDVGTWKPNPGIYEFAARDMGYSPAECAAIEDSLVGVEAGVNAGVRTYFYNIHQDQCDWQNVVSFKSMFELPMLIAQARD